MNIEEFGSSQPSSQKKKVGIRSIGVGTALLVLTGICIWLAIQVNYKKLQYYTPAPVSIVDAELTPYEFQSTDFIQSLPSASLRTSFANNKKRAKEAIEDLQSKGLNDRADDLQNRLDKITSSSSGDFFEVDKPQTHIVALHEAGDATVRVTHKHAPIILVLSAYNAVNWSVEVDEGVKLSRVIVGGSDQQRVSGVPKGVELEGQLTKQRVPEFCFDGFRRTDLPKIDTALGYLGAAKRVTFQGQYECPDSPIFVGPESKPWLSEMASNAIEEIDDEAMTMRWSEIAKEIVKIKTHGVALSGVGTGRTQSSFCFQSVFGPYSRTMVPLEQPVKQITLDPNGPSYYGITNGGLVTIDVSTGEVAPFPFKGTLPSRPTAIAFDEKRHRVLVWGSRLFAINVLDKTFENLRKGDWDRAVALAYSKTDDLFYAIRTAYAGGRINGVVLKSYNSKGSEVGSVPLDLQLFYDEPRGSVVHMHFVDGKLLIASYGQVDGNGYFIPSNVNYLVEPSTGELIFACKREVRR